MDWYKQFESSLSREQFNQVLLSYFQWKFDELGCNGAIICHDASWSEADLQTPFYGLCHTLANYIRDTYRFLPFVSELYGSSSKLVSIIGSGKMRVGTLACGLMASFDNCHLRLFLEVDTSIIVLFYDWPESYCKVDEDGCSEGGSSTTIEYVFDLNDPDSIEKLTNVVKRRCADMINKSKPSD